MLDYWTKGITGALDKKVGANEDEVEAFVATLENAILVPFDSYDNNPVQTMLRCSDPPSWKNWLGKYSQFTSMLTVCKQKTASGTYYHAAYGATALRIKV